MPSEFIITACPREEQADALRTLHDGLDPTLAANLVQTLHALETAGTTGEGLFVAGDRAGAPVAACWVQLLPGKTAVLWPPPTDHPAAAALLSAAGDYLDQANIPLAQYLAPRDSAMASPILATGGFLPLAELVFLVAPAEHFPPAPPATELEFVPAAADESQRLGTVLVQTYIDSLDCPAVDGLREPADILTGYAAQGNFLPDQWYFVRHREQDLGVLILASHAEGETWELVYMGLAPPGRGRGFGKHVLQHALWQARRGQAQRLVLAVDAANHRALPLYRATGFAEWDRRQVYARLTA